MSDCIQLCVSETENDLDNDARPVFLDGGMPCPVPACGLHHFETHNALWGHWKKTHREFVRCFKCSLCSFKNTIRSQLGRHYRLRHKQSSKEAATSLAMTKSSPIRNEKYVDTQGYLCPRRKVCLHAAAREEASTLRNSTSSVSLFPSPEHYNCREEVIRPVH